ncbi:MAG: ankyrin repeat domain-containing protein [Noviherbaspirillum sp.]
MRKNEAMQTPVALAARLGLCEILPLLLKHGEAVDGCGCDGIAPLIHAVRSGNGNMESMLELLLKNGADPDARDSAGRTALFDAVRSGRTNTVTFLLDRGGNPNVQDAFGLSPLCALMRLERNAVYSNALQYDWEVKMHPEERLDMAKLLVQRGANSNLADFAGQDALWYAIDRGHVSAVKFFLAQGAAVNRRDHFRMTRLHYGARLRYTEIVRILIDGGADIHAVTDEGQGSLHYAVESGGSALVELLLEKSVPADQLNRMNAQGLTPLGAGLEVVSLIHSSLALLRDPTVISSFQFSEAGIPCIEFKSPAFKSRTIPLPGAFIHHALATFQRSSIIVDMPRFIKALQAEYAQYLETFGLLLKKGANPNAGGLLGAAPLLKASILGLEEVVSLLLEHGADITQVDAQGRSAQSLARIRGHERIVSILERHGEKRAVKSEAAEKEAGAQEGGL